MTGTHNQNHDSGDVQDNADFAKQEYWEARYKRESAVQPDGTSKTFEWLKGWDFYKTALSPLLSPHSRILHLGCGNSTLSPDMYKAGYTHQTNMDYSHSVITTMSNMYKHELPDITWLVGDIFDMSRTLFLETAPCFDIVIDKGTMDAWLTGWTDEDPWAPSEACLAKAREYVSEVENVLVKHPDSKFIQITWSQPHFRRAFLESTGRLDVKVLRVGTDWEFFVFVCTFKADIIAQ